MLITDDLNILLESLPPFVKEPLKDHPQKESLIEVVMDLGRRPEARFPNRPEYLSNEMITCNDLNYCIKRIGNFSGDNRAGIERTLHRISCVRNRDGSIVGLTCRVGRAIFGTINIIRDLLQTGKSLLLVGKPGVGKTTAIREVARVLANEMEKRVVIIDTSNEIAGDGDVPHSSIGRARRMQVSKPELQHHVMIEAVENHMPEVIIIDEIGTEFEAAAACTIAERGVQLVGTAHGNYLNSLIKNPTLSDLIGGVEYVTLGDDEAKRRGTQKSVLERRTTPVFDIAIEIHERYCWIIHENVEQAVDCILQGKDIPIQKRRFNPIGQTIIDYSSDIANIDFNANANWKNSQSKFSGRNNKESSRSQVALFNPDLASNFRGKEMDIIQSIKQQDLAIYSYGINTRYVDNIIAKFDFPIVTTRKIEKADCILSVRSHIKHNTQIRHVAKIKKIAIQTVRLTSMLQIVRAIYSILNWEIKQLDVNKLMLIAPKTGTLTDLEAFEEARLAIEKFVVPHRVTVELLPRNVAIRRLQHELIRHYKLKVRTIGEEPDRRLRIYSN
nr:Ycf45 [Erythrotrichia welwitschii]